MDTKQLSLRNSLMLYQDRNYRHLDGKVQWNLRYPMRKNTNWVKRIAEECMLGLPISYLKGFKSEPSICRNIPLEYAETFSRELKIHNKLANTLIWC